MSFFGGLPTLDNFTPIVLWLWVLPVHLNLFLLKAYPWNMTYIVRLFFFFLRFRGHLIWCIVTTWLVLLSLLSSHQAVGPVLFSVMFDSFLLNNNLSTFIKKARLTKFWSDSNRFYSEVFYCLHNVEIVLHPLKEGPV